MNIYSLKKNFFRVLLTSLVLIAPLTPIIGASVTHSTSGFLSQAHSISNMPAGYVVTKITGKLDGSAIGGATAFTAIRVNSNLFIAQMAPGKYKKGVFLRINYKNKTIEPVTARYCINCPNRNINLNDTNIGFIANSPTAYGYGVLDLSILMEPVATIASSYVTTASGAITTQGVTIPHFINGNVISSMTGVFSGNSVDNPTSFTAIILGENSFLAQIVASEYKKGVFFAIQSDGKIKATQARYCVIADCQNRNVLLTDKQGSITTNPDQWGYGIFNLQITSLSNLAYGLTATESSIYNGKGPSATVASRAVDGDTNGNWNDGSVSGTNNDSKAWWQVDLGSSKLIQQINIFNRTDCCMDRLTNYSVTIFDNLKEKPTYQQEFHSYPKSKSIIDLGIQRVRGRYVKIQLLDSNFLSLAEVQVLGFEAYEPKN